MMNYNFMRPRTLLRKIHTSILKVNTKKKALFLSLTLAALLIIVTAVSVTGGTPSSAELRFSEFSSNKDLKGGVLPASCESFPTIGINHGVSSTVPAGGHCNPCPINTRLKNVVFYLCYDNAQGNNQSWLPNGCSGAYPFTAGSQLVYPLCQWAYNPACPAYYIDQACPPPPPTVNIQFN